MQDDEPIIDENSVRYKTFLGINFAVVKNFADILLSLLSLKFKPYSQALRP